MVNINVRNYLVENYHMTCQNRDITIYMAKITLYCLYSGVIDGTAFIEVQFFNQMMCLTASPPLQ